MMIWLEPPTQEDGNPKEHARQQLMSAQRELAEYRLLDEHGALWPWEVIKLGYLNIRVRVLALHFKVRYGKTSA